MQKLLLKNGNIHDAVKAESCTADILVIDGKIAKIEKDITEEGAEILDVTGREIYPGFIDAHCHIGLIGFAIGFEGSDVNEMTDILTPQLRAIDGINPQDETFADALTGGVTCVATGPGSANVLGGTFVAIKTYGKRVDDMIVKDPIAPKYIIVTPKGIFSIEI